MIDQLVWTMIAAMALSGRAVETQSAPPAAVPRAESDGWITLPSSFAFNTPNVEVHVNGEGPYWFTLDTGATTSAIDSWLARPRLTFRDSDPIQTGTEGKGVVGVVVTIGGREHKPPVAAVFRLAEATNSVIHGILGADFFREFAVEIDYAAETVRIHPLITFRGAAQGTAVPFVIDTHDLPTVMATVVSPAAGAIDAHLILDTGFSIGVGLTRECALGRELIPEDQVKEDHAGPRVRFYTVDGQRFGVPLPLERMEIGAVVFERPRAIVDDATGWLTDGWDGVVGSSAFADHRVTIDYQRRVVTVERVRESLRADPPELGFTLRTTQVGHVVVRVEEGSILAQAGGRSMTSCSS